MTIKVEIITVYRLFFEISKVAYFLKFKILR